MAEPGRDGKPRRRSRRGRGEESDGCTVPVKPRTKPTTNRWRRWWREGAGRREGEQQRTPRTQCRIRRVTEAASLRIGGAWAAKAPNLNRVRPLAGARCGKAARRDLRGGAGATRSPTATQGVSWFVAPIVTGFLDRYPEASIDLRT